MDWFGLAYHVSMIVVLTCAIIVLVRYPRPGAP